MDYSPPGSSVREILQARMLEWVAIPSSRGYCWFNEVMQIDFLQMNFFLPRSSYSSATNLMQNPYQVLRPLSIFVSSCSQAADSIWNYIKIIYYYNNYTYNSISSVQFSSVTQSCPALSNSMNRSTPGLPVHHHLPEFTQTHVRVGDAIQPSHPLSSPFPPAPNPSQHQSLF